MKYDIRVVAFIDILGFKNAVDESLKDDNEFNRIKTALTDLNEFFIRPKNNYEIEADRADALGNEPIYYKNERVGLTTSGSYGFRVNKSLAFAYVNSDLTKNDTKFLIDIQGKKVKAKIIEEPAFDPKNLRLKS